MNERKHLLKAIKDWEAVSAKNQGAAILENWQVAVPAPERERPGSQTAGRTIKLTRPVCWGVWGGGFFWGGVGGGVGGGGGVGCCGVWGGFWWRGNCEVFWGRVVDGFVLGGWGGGF